MRYLLFAGLVCISIFASSCVAFMNMGVKIVDVRTRDSRFVSAGIYNGFVVDVSHTDGTYVTVRDIANGTAVRTFDSLGKCKRTEIFPRSPDDVTYLWECAVWHGGDRFADTDFNDSGGADLALYDSLSGEHKTLWSGGLTNRVAKSMTFLSASRLLVILGGCETPPTNDEIICIDTDTGARKVLASFPWTELSSYALAPTKDALAYWDVKPLSGGETHIVLIDPASGEEKGNISIGPDCGIGCMSWSPNADALAYELGCEAGTVFEVYRMDSGKRFRTHNLIVEDSPFSPHKKSRTPKGDAQGVTFAKSSSDCLIFMTPLDNRRVVYYVLDGKDLESPWRPQWPLRVIDIETGAATEVGTVHRPVILHSLAGGTKFLCSME